jgi:deoxycytidine triphosphate deaminase
MYKRDKEETMIQQATFMNDVQIDKARREGELVICPYNRENLTPVGYNLSFSGFIVSLGKKAFVKMKHKDNEWFFYLKPHETVLVWTRETIWVSRFIGGTFHSKVSLVTNGLGQVSTTLDPGWHGQLLVPLNNPTKRKIKVVIAHDGENGKEFETFITMVLYRAQEASMYEKSDNKAARTELLENILKDKKKDHDAQQLLRLVYRVKESDNKMDELCDLNDPIDRREKIKMFEKEHRNVIKEIDKEFDRLNQFSTKMYNARNLIYWGSVVIVFLGIIVVTVLIQVKGDDTTKNIFAGCIGVVTTLLVWGFEQIRAKYL